MTEPEPEPKGGKRRVIVAIAKFVLGVAILVALLFWIGADWDEVRSRFHWNWGWAAASLCGTAFATAFTAARWRLLNERMTATRLPYGPYFHYIALTRFIGQFTSLLLMDLVGRGYGLKVAGSKQGLGRLLTPVLLERLVDLLLPAVVFAWALLVPAQYKWTALVVLAVAFTAGIIPLVQPIARFALAAYIRLRRWRGAAVESEVVEVDRITATWVSVYSMGRFLTVLLQFIGAGAAAGALLGFDVVLGAFSVQQMSAVIAITPGGLGVQEAGWFGGLQMMGEPEEVITLFILATRVFVVANFGLLSLVTLPLVRKR